MNILNRFELSLAVWSLRREIESGRLRLVDVPRYVRSNFNIEAIELITRLLPPPDSNVFGDLKRAASDAGCRNTVLMIDHQGELGSPESSRRTEAIANHKRWMDTAIVLGCSVVRVNAHSEGGWDDQLALLEQGLTPLLVHAEELGLRVLVENNKRLSSNAAFLVALMKRIGRPRLGTLPDFGNFRIDENTSYDPYLGVAELLPYAGDVSAKSFDFNAAGFETTIDYPRMMRLILASSYTGTIAIEYEGRRLPEPEGIKLTKALIESSLRNLSAA